MSVVGSELVDLGAGGVKVDGSDAAGDPRGRTSGVRISDDEIHAIGRVFASAVGVLVRHAADVEIAHDEIHDTYYTAVSAGWVWGYAPSVTKAIRVEKNHIHDIGQGVLSDMGGVYTLGIQPGSVIRGNHVHDVKAAGYGGWAIYPDEGSSHLVIEDNVAHDTTGHVFHQHYGNENVVRNNVFAFGAEGTLALSRGPSWNGGRGRLALTLFRNVLVSDGTPLIAAGLGGDEEAFAASRRFDSELNVLWDVTGRAPQPGRRPRSGEGRPAQGLRPRRAGRRSASTCTRSPRTRCSSTSPGATCGCGPARPRWLSASGRSTSRTSGRGRKGSDEAAEAAGRAQAVRPERTAAIVGSVST